MAPCNALSLCQPGYGFKAFLVRTQLRGFCMHMQTD